MHYVIIRFDVLGYVSAVVAHNQYTSDAATSRNSAIGGLERARTMHRLRIRLETVREWGAGGPHCCHQFERRLMCVTMHLTLRYLIFNFE
jgi:hypothetical protein